MKTKIINITNAKGITYVYEDTPYRDKEKGYATHKRVCIGKLDKDGNIVYNKNYKTRETIKQLQERNKELSVNGPKEIEATSTTTLVGQRLILDNEAKKCKIEKALVPAFGKDDADKIMALAYYLICRGKALSRSAQWLETRGFSELKLTSQRISELLARLSDDKINTFFKKWIELQPKSNRSCLFDITSVSTYGKDNPWAEYGYNRDKENLEQINISLLTSCSSGLPLWCKILSGSISDKSVLHSTISELEKLGVGRFDFCGDRGFFSEKNLKMLNDKNIRFTIPMPSSIKESKNLIEQHKGMLIHPDNLIDEGGNKIYGKTVYKVTEYGRTYYHIFFDPTRKDMIQANFMLKLQKCKDELESCNLIEAHKSMYDEYFTVKETPKRGRKVVYNDNALQAYINSNSCYWVLMSTCEKDVRRALHSYRERSAVELAFDDMKNLLDLNRLRNHNEYTVRGKVFVNFISLILLSSLRRAVDAIAPKDRMYLSETDMLDRVETYTRIHFDGKYKDVFSTPTKTQRTIFDLLNIEYNLNGEVVNSKKKKLETKSSEAEEGMLEKSEKQSGESAPKS